MSLDGHYTFTESPVFMAQKMYSILSHFFIFLQSIIFGSPIRKIQYPSTIFEFLAKIHVYSEMH